MFKNHKQIICHSANFCVRVFFTIQSYNLMGAEAESVMSGKSSTSQFDVKLHTVWWSDIDLDQHQLSVRWMQLQESNLCIFILFLHKPSSPLAFHCIFSISQQFLRGRLFTFDISYQRKFSMGTHSGFSLFRSSDHWCSCCLVRMGLPNIIIIMKNFNRRDSHSHNGSMCWELAQHSHSHGSHTFTHTLTSTVTITWCEAPAQLLFFSACFVFP